MIKWLKYTLIEQAEWFWIDDRLERILQKVDKATNIWYDLINRFISAHDIWKCDTKWLHGKQVELMFTLSNRCIRVLQGLKRLLINLCDLLKVRLSIFKLFFLLGQSNISFSKL